MLHSLECLFGAASLAFRAVLEAGLLNYQETVGSEKQPPPTSSHPLAAAKKLFITCADEKMASHSLATCSDTSDPSQHLTGLSQQPMPMWAVNRRAAALPWCGPDSTGR